MRRNEDSSGNIRAVVEGIARVDVVAERDVRQFQRDHRRDRRFCNARIVAGMVSIRPLLTRMVLPTVVVSMVSVSMMRQCTGRLKLKVVRHDEVDDDLIEHRLSQSHWA